jgi:hypothetical protein
MDKTPAFISYVVLVHGGSYQKFLQQVVKSFPELRVVFCKKVAIHYYIVQLEDHSETPVTKKQIAGLPIMAFREELSSFLIFKGGKGLKTTLSRMCEEEEDDDASIELVEKMLTPFEKSQILNLAEADSLEFEEPLGEGQKGTKVTTIYDKNEIKSIETLNKLFRLDKVKINKEDIDLKELVKTKFDKKWIIGVM